MAHMEPTILSQMRQDITHRLNCKWALGLTHPWDHNNET